MFEGTLSRLIPEPWTGVTDIMFTSGGLGNKCLSQFELHWTITQGFKQKAMENKGARVGQPRETTAAG